MQLHESVKGALTDSDSLKTVYQQLHIVNKNDKDGLPHMCSICSKKFRKAKYLYVHIRQIHTNDESKKYRCTECGRGFILIHSFRMHMRTHTNSRPYKCRLCEKSFKQRAHIRDHLLSHSSKFRTSCCICGKAFKGKGSAKSHILSHCKTKPFSCPVCPEKFADMGQLTNHFSNIPHSQSEKKGELLKMFKCPMCTTFQCEQKHDMLRHFDNHTMEKHFQCEKCNVKFRRYLELYYHKTKFDHFVDSDFEGVTKITCPTVWKNIRSSEIFDQYTLEELQTMFVYQPDTSELSRPELEEMVNPKVVSDYDDELWYLRKKNAKTQAPKRNVSNEDLEDIEYKEVNSAEVSQQNTDIEYEDDLLTVAEQLTHMADMDQTGYPEVVIPSSMADKTDNKPAFVTIDSNQDIFTQANQLQLDSNFDIGSPWSTDFLIKTPSHKNILYQDHSGRYNAGSNSAVVQTPSYSKTTQEETASATNNLLQENNIESGLTNVNSHFTSANLKSEVVRSAFKPVAASAKSPVEQTYQTTQTVAASKPAVQQTFNIIDESGNEMLVYVLNETAENNDILNIIQSGGSDCKTTVSVATANASMDIGEHKLLADGRSKASAGFLEDIPDMDEMERNTGFNVTVSDNRTAAFTAGNRTQLHMNRDEKPITSHINTDQSLAQRNTSKEQISSAKLLRGSRIFVEDYLNKLDEAQKEVIQAAKKDPDYHPDSSDDSSGEEEEEEDDKDTQVKFRQIKLFNKHNENTGK